ncbi:MAG: DNA replication/repair protein RecF [Bacteroidetes bacterium]|nr:DNA replication/repair protein RecF [Bacteroidota bacterium]
MHLQNISLINFKNYSQVELEFSARINCFVGNNGVGKTNILDAIHYLSLTKSFFNSIDSQNIKYDEDFFVIQGTFIKDDTQENIYCSSKRNRKKQFKKNKKEYQRLADHIGLLPVVMISPADTNLIVGGSDERRKFINTVISQYDRNYLNDLIQYNKALAQRNKLLKDFARSGRFEPESLELWDEQLIPLSEKIYAKRMDFIEKLVPVFQKYYDSIASGNESVGLVYHSHHHDGNFRNVFREALDKDRILQYTTRGIHKDDLVLELDDYQIKRVGSQGQQKTYLVALKFAEYEFIRDVSGFEPILLLDDIFDKFDASRVMQIIHLVSENQFGQIFITDTHQSRLEKILSELSADFRLFRINKEITDLSEERRGRVEEEVSGER